MSIPKEPRQLMINLMYLVLTALLALNVSAEVMNAFFTINKGINNSNAIVENTNSTLLANIEKQADAYRNDQNEQYRQRAREVKQVADEFYTYVEELKAEVFEKAGGPSEKDPEKPKREKDKDVTTRLLVGLENQPGRGYDLMQKIEDTRAKFLELVDNDPGVTAAIPLGIDEEAVAKSKKKDWVHYNFLQMPVAAVFPILSKMQNDARASSTTALNYLLGKVAGEDIKFDAFEPVISAPKGYVIRGEKYMADVFLSAYSSSAGDNTKIYVNGSSLPVKDGKATFETSTGGSLGSKQYEVRIDVTNPLTGDVKSYKKTFEYEVGERSVAVSADKMNVFYIGVENPVSVSAAGISTNDLNVSISDGNIRKTGTGSYNVTVQRPGEVRVNVSGGGMRDSKVFRVKRIPDPTARLGKLEDGLVGNGEFKAQGGVIAWLDNFDFDARCDIAGFELVYVPQRQDPVPVQNQGARFNGRSEELVRRAKPGDTYYLNNVRAKCPGDSATRKINSLVFRIK